jgi:hypothetical protein
MVFILNISLTFNSDNKGYLDRQCPNNDCLFAFEVNISDWKN